MFVADAVLRREGVVEGTAGAVERLAEGVGSWGVRSITAGAGGEGECEGRLEEAVSRPGGDPVCTPLSCEPQGVHCGCHNGAHTRMYLHGELSPKSLKCHDAKQNLWPVRPPSKKCFDNRQRLNQELEGEGLILTSYHSILTAEISYGTPLVYEVSFSHACSVSSI